MFTGIIEETGVVRSIQPSDKSIRLTVEAGALTRGLKLGDSVAVNGACLTVVGLAGRMPRRRMSFDLLRETWSVTNLQYVRPGSLVNLERPLRAGGRLDGHFVTGHVDGLGTITRWDRVGQDHRLEVELPAALRKLMVPKGSIAVDGISLTVAAVLPRGVRLWIIPHTFDVTALRERQTGDAVNVEGDILGKYVARFVGRR
jgi:riboflavin synthase